jgi:hypothetical protein
MSAGIRLNLRTACLFLLALAASIPLAASPTHATLHLYPAAAITQPILHAPASTSSANPCPQESVAAPANSIGRRFTRRVFLESTNAPAGEALKTARLQAPTQLYTPPLPESPALRNPAASAANRQRAP